MQHMQIQVIYFLSGTVILDHVILCKRPYFVISDRGLTKRTYINIVNLTKKKYLGRFGH